MPNLWRLDAGPFQMGAPHWVWACEASPPCSDAFGWQTSGSSFATGFAVLVLWSYGKSLLPVANSGTCGCALIVNLHGEHTRPWRPSQLGCAFVSHPSRIGLTNIFESKSWQPETWSCKSTTVSRIGWYWLYGNEPAFQFNLSVDKDLQTYPFLVCPKMFKAILSQNDTQSHCVRGSSGGGWTRVLGTAGWSQPAFAAVASQFWGPRKSWENISAVLNIMVKLVKHKKKIWSD